MNFSIAELRAQSRRAVHELASVPAVYKDDIHSDVELRVRWHRRVANIGDVQDGGYSFPELTTGVNRLIFNVEELVEKNLRPKRGATIVIEGPEGRTKLRLDTLENSEGPITLIWNVTSEP